MMVGTDFDHAAQTEELEIALAQVKALRDMLRLVLESDLIDRKGHMWPKSQALLRKADALVAR